MRCGAGIGAVPMLSSIPVMIAILLVRRHWRGSAHEQ
jgi:hypothetical protein